MGLLVVRATKSLPAGFGVIWTTVALDLVGFGILFPVLARYARDAGASPATAGAIVASFSIAQLVCSPLTGRLSDHIGRKPVIIMSLVGTAVGSLLTGLAGSVWLLFLGRIVDGASGASVSVAQAAVTDVAAPEDRARLLGLLGAAFGAGFALGPAIGGVAALVSHRLPFFIAAGIAAANALAAVKRLPETRQQVDKLSTSSPMAAGSARRTGPGLRRLVVITFLGLVAFSGFEATFSLLVEARFDLSESATYGLFFLVGVGLVVVQGGAIHTVVVRLGETRTVRLGLACNALGLALLALDAGWAPVTVALALLIVGQGIVAPTLSSLIAASAPTERRGQVLGVQQSAGGLARSIGPALAGFLFGRSIPSPYVVGAVLAALALLLVTDR